MGRVEGKVAIVTGGASGLGRETSALLAREGARVVVADVNEVAGTGFAKELGAAARFAHLDVRDEASWQQVIEETESSGVLQRTADEVDARCVEELPDPGSIRAVGTAMVDGLDVEVYLDGRGGEFGFVGMDCSVYDLP